MGNEDIVDEILRTKVQKEALEMPNSDFTDRILDKINTSPQTRPIRAFSLGRGFWIALSLLSILILAYVVAYVPRYKFSMDFKDISWVGDNLLDFSFSPGKMWDSLVMGILVFGVFSWVQIVWLQHRITKRFQ